VVERTREFGVLLALGTTPRQIVAIVLTEASLLGVAATLAGLAVGLAVNQHFAVVGYDLTQWMGKTYEASGILIPKQFFPQLDPTKVAISAAVIFGLVMAGAAYPALRAARLEPVEAIRHE
jgi:ABC-type antimicrobial peptide transport system permease subunit